MKTAIRITQVDAFTDVPLTGNPAGVVADAGGLTDRQMLDIARELAVSETAFVLPPTTPMADLRLRWFTPSNEVPLCGHATVAAFHALAESALFSMAGTGSFGFRVETASGILPVTVEKSATSITVTFGLPVPEFQRAGQFKLDIVRLIGVTLEDMDARLPIVQDSYLYAPLRRLHTLFALKPNHSALAQFLSNRGFGGLCLFTTEVVDHDSAFHSRFFAPHQGIAEDPVTGSANGPLGVYLFEQRIVEARGSRLVLIGEQGDAIGRRGRVTVTLTVEGTRVTGVTIGGRAVTVLGGEMLTAPARR